MVQWNRAIVSFWCELAVPRHVVVSDQMIAFKFPFVLYGSQNQVTGFVGGPSKWQVTRIQNVTSTSWRRASSTDVSFQRSFTIWCLNMSCEVGGGFWIQCWLVKQCFLSVVSASSSLKTLWMGWGHKWVGRVRTVVRVLSGGPAPALWRPAEEPSSTWS